jgi:hypothetical protein
VSVVVGVDWWAQVQAQLQRAGRVAVLRVQARVKTTGGKRRGGARGVTSSRGSGWHGLGRGRQTPRSVRPRRPCGHSSAVATTRWSALTRAGVAALLCYTPSVCACTQTAVRCPWPGEQMRRACVGGGGEGEQVKGRWWRREDTAPATEDWWCWPSDVGGKTWAGALLSCTAERGGEVKQWQGFGCVFNCGPWFAGPALAAPPPQCTVPRGRAPRDIMSADCILETL